MSETSEIEILKRQYDTRLNRNGKGTNVRLSLHRTSNGTDCDEKVPYDAVCEDFVIVAKRGNVRETGVQADPPAAGRTARM